MAEVKLGPWPAGMNNVAQDYAMPTNKYGKPVALRNAVNVDIDNSGFLGRRKGYAKIVSGTGVRDGFSCATGTYFVEGASLKRLNSDNTTTTLFVGITGAQCSYELVGTTVYFSDGIVNKKILSDGSVISWGLNVPAAPVLSGVVGTYGEGTYIGAITFVTADGQESGASEFRSISVAKNAGIKFDALPSPQDPQVNRLRLYLSAADGVVLYMAGEVAAGTVSHSVTAGRYDSGKPLDLQFISKPPPGRIVREFRGRMYIADAYGAVWPTEPYAYDHVKTASSFFQFSKPVTVFEPVRGGVWIVADKTYFYAGTGPEDFLPQTMLDYGAVFGTSQRVPNSDDVLWYSERGVVKGSADGQIENLQEKHVAAENGSSGAAHVRESDGVRQFIASIRNTQVSPLAAQSFLEMEVVRKATP